MISNLEFKYQNNIFFLVFAVLTVTFLVLSFSKKERILSALRLNYKLRFKALRTILLFLGMVLISISLLGPQIFDGYAEVEKTGMDIYVLIDTSKSMLVSDIMPDRISVAKKIVSSIMNGLQGDRIGFIPFASDAYIQMPLTDDYRLAEMFLDVIDTNMISGGGTNLAAAINLANNSFDRASNSSADKVIIIISDGEEHDNASQTAIKNTTDFNVKIFTIGVGTEKGGLVPIYDANGTAIVDYTKDSTGNPVTSRLNANSLKALAQQSNGGYYEATTQGIDVAQLLDQLSGLEKDTRGIEQIKKLNHIYQYFLGAGVLLFLISWFLPERRIS